MSRKITVDDDALEAINLKLRHLAGAAFTAGEQAGELEEGTLCFAIHAIEDSCEMIAAEIDRLGEEPENDEKPNVVE